MRSDAAAAVPQTGFLARLPPDLATAVIEGSQLAEYPAQAVTFVGDEEVRAGIAVYGLQRVYLIAPDGRELTIRYVRAGELLGAIHLPSIHVSVATQALEEAAVLHLKPAHLERLADQHPALAMALVDEYVERLGQAYRTLNLRAFATVQERVAHDLASRAEALGTTE
jgi:CRP-like cAMP-binding protein